MKLKKFLPLLFALLLFHFVSVDASTAASGNCSPSIAWVLENGILTLSGSGAIPDYDSSSVPWYSNRTSIKSVIIEEGITAIGNYAFNTCTNLNSLTIPSSVTHIDKLAFNGCSNIKNVYADSIESWCNIDFEHSNSNPLSHNKDSVLYINNQILTIATIPDGATKIKDYTFANCRNLTRVIIPDSVISIGNRAFFGCTNLASIDIPKSVTTIDSYAFCNCTALTNITIPDGVTSIGTIAFSGCTSLENITLSDNVTSIGESAFKNTSYYSNSANWDNNVLYVNNHLIEARTTVANEYSIKPGTITIADCAFSGNVYSTTKITIPDSTMAIGDSAFAGCSNLESITIPKNVVRIGTNAIHCQMIVDTENAYFAIENDVLFDKDMKTLLRYPRKKTDSSYTIPNSVTSISTSAFSYCTALESIVIPDTVTNIGNSAFIGCTNLNNIYAESIEGWCNIEFANMNANPLSVDHLNIPYEHTRTLYINNVVAENITLPESVTAIRDFAFSGCTSLTNINIPDSVTSIGTGAFRECKNIENIIIPDSVTNIDSYAFIYSTKLKSVTLSNNLANINDNCFNGCTSLTSINIPVGVTNIGEYAFYNCENLAKITLPDGLLSIGSSAFEHSGLTSIVIPDTISIINSYSFGHTELASIVIPNGITNIGVLAFRYCTNLQNITMPDSVKYIGLGAFQECSSLKTIYYNGNQNDWSEIYIENTNDALLNAYIYYKENVITFSNHQVSGGDNLYTYSFNMNAESSTKGELIIALYNNDTLVGCVTESLIAPSTEYIATDKTVSTIATPTTYKIFFWSNLTDLVPLCQYAEGLIN